jgi:hypothetical protein
MGFTADVGKPWDLLVPVEYRLVGMVLHDPAGMSIPRGALFGCKLAPLTLTDR